MPQHGILQTGIDQAMKPKKRLLEPSAPEAARAAGIEESRFGIAGSRPRYDGEGRRLRVCDSFREQMIAFLPRLSRFAYALTGNADQRDDLVQETCLRALANRNQWQPGTRLESWMFRIAQNLWIDGMRAQRSRGERVDIEAIDAALHADGFHEAETRLALAEVVRGLARLPPEHRVVIALVCVDSLTYQEAAEVLHLPVGTVMSRLARARIALHDAINRIPAPGTGSNRGSRGGRPFR
jgi:RNA polymerase sigma-70 factor (ECF subfamily)